MKGPVQTLLEGERQRRRHRGPPDRSAAREGHPRAVRPRHRGHARAPGRGGDRHRERRAGAARLPARGGPERAVSGPGGIAAIRVERVWAEAYVPYANYRGAVLDGFEKAWVPLDPGLKRLDAPGGYRRPLRRLRPRDRPSTTSSPPPRPHAPRVLPPAGHGGPRRAAAGRLLRGGPRAPGRDRAEPGPASLHASVRGRRRAPRSATPRPRRSCTRRASSSRGTARLSSTRPSRCRRSSASGSPSPTSPSRRTTRRS